MTTTTEIRPDRTMNVLVELDVDRVKDQIRDAVVELVDERDRARNSAALLEAQLAETRALLEEALRSLGRRAPFVADRIAHKVARLDRGDSPVPMCACPTALADGHVCEPS